ncbi:MAG: T9SS type A sorting domain-containing protein, partial [Calditrichaeota bacterium]|nr:T9SS type A sorting domain-containing protein [Calditrichota bacterium]
IAEMSQPIVIRGVRLVKVDTYPIQYNYESESYLYYPHIETEICYTDAPPVNPVRNPNRSNRSREFLKYIKEFAINGDIVGRDDPDGDRIPEFLGHYLVVSHENCLEFARPFIEWRRKSGYKIDILNLTANQARNSALVKREIQERYDEYLNNGIDPFDYILLIGDRNLYWESPRAEWILHSFFGESTWGGDDFAYHADYLYACLEGGNNDRYPDVGISRWHSGSRDQMELTVGRTLAYEAEPHMDNPAWFRRGAVYSQNWGHRPSSAWHITIQSNARWGLGVLDRIGFNDIGFYENFTWDRRANSLGPNIRDWLNDGCNIMLGRAECYYFDGSPPGEGNFDRDIEDNVVFPINLNHAGHAEFYAEALTRYGSGNHLKGAVATTWGWGAPGYTAPISASWMEMINGFVLKDMPLGWARIHAITSIERYFGGGARYILENKTEFDVFGDPGLKPWLGVPEIVSVEFPESVTSDSKRIDCFVHDDEGTGIAGAQVTIYNPGNIPDNAEEYADYDEYCMKTQLTASNGETVFVIDDDFQLDEGTVLLTITGRDIRPSFNQIEIVESLDRIELNDYELTEVDGNEDQLINPGETFELILTAKNTGERRYENVTAIVETESNWVQIEQGETRFGRIESGETVEGEERIRVTITDDCPDGISRPVTKPRLEIEFRSQEDVWESIVMLEPHAPHFTLQRLLGGNFISYEEQDLNLEINNIGSVDSPQLNARLISLDNGVNVRRREAAFPPVRAGERCRISEDPFRVIGTRAAIPGSSVDLILILETESGFVDSVAFQHQVGEPAADSPQGPDDHGYYCFDDTDTDWESAPEYNWIEICPDDDDREFDGISLNFDGRSPHDIGESEVIETDFTIQFYGIEYDRITISSNGFIAVGEQPLMTNFQNWPLDRAIGGGMGMIAPFWDNLDLSGDGHVCYYFDEERNRFIVEWYNLRHRTNGNRNLTFQVVFTGEVTATGDTPIMFQYKGISDLDGNGDWRVSIPFASIGISSPYGNTGLSYVFNDVYSPTSARLQIRRVIKYQTSTESESFQLYGTVRDHDTNQGLSDALVSVRNTLFTETDSTGYWHFESVPIFDSLMVTAHKIGFIDSSVYLNEVENGDSLEINFSLLHAEISISDSQFTANLEPDQEIEFEFQVENNGNGPLDWTIEKQMVTEEQYEPWDLKNSIPAGEIVGDERLYGGIFCEDRFFIAGAGEDLPMIYVLDREGRERNRFDQPHRDNRNGMKDLTFDGEFIWGAIENEVFGMNIDCEVMENWFCQYNPVQAMAWDSELEVIWVAGITSDPIAYKRDGQRVDSLVINRSGLRIYGLAYYPEDKDDCNLYIYHVDRDSRLPTIHKVNPLIGDTTFVAILPDESGGEPKGAFITKSYDPNSWIMCSVNHDSEADGGDKIHVWHLDWFDGWFNVDVMTENDRSEAVSGQIAANESTDFYLNLSSVGLNDIHLNSILCFEHNADDADISIDIELIVTDYVSDQLKNNDKNSPVIFGLSSIYPNPFNSTTSISYTLPKSDEVRLSIHDLHGREIAILQNGMGQMGYHTVHWNAVNQPSGLYLCRLESNRKVSTAKLMLMK